MSSFWTILLQLFKVNESRDNQCGVTPHFSTGQNLFFKKKEKSRGISWFVCAKQYIIVSWCILYIRYTTHRYEKDNKKYMKDYDRNK